MSGSQEKEEEDNISVIIRIKPEDNSQKYAPINVSNSNSISIINERKELYSGLCFENKKDAKAFMEKHKAELDSFAKSNPLFDHWSIMSVMNKFQPKSKLVYGKDVKED